MSGNPEKAGICLHKQTRLQDFYWESGGIAVNATLCAVLSNLEPWMAEGLVHTVPLPHLHLKKVIDKICGCGLTSNYQI